MRSPQEIHALLKERADALGLSQTEVCRRALGQDDASAFKNLLKGSWPSVDRLEALSRVLGLDFYFGPRREGEQKAPTAVEDGFAAVPRLEVEISAGPGREPMEGVIERLQFRSDWLGRIGVDPRMASIVAVRGDSMEPGLSDGDLVLIDRKRTKVKSGRVYAFTDADGLLRVKRLELTGDGTGLILRSDNPRAPTEVRQGEDASAITVHGQVVWSAHTWPVE